MDSVSEEAVEKLMQQKGDKEVELNILAAKKIEEIWLNELEKLKDEYIKFINKDMNAVTKNSNESKKKVIIVKKKSNK